MQACKNQFIKTITFKFPWLHFAVYSACKLSSSLLSTFKSMTSSEKTHLEFTESQLLIIKDQNKSWTTKDQVIDIMRYRYGRVKDQAA